MVPDYKKLPVQWEKRESQVSDVSAMAQGAAKCYASPR